MIVGCAAQAVGSLRGPAALGGLVDLTDWGLLMAFTAGFAPIGLALTFGVCREVAESQLAEKSYLDAAG